MTVFDSQGNAHDMSVYFVKTKDNTWQVYTRDSSDAASRATAATTLEFNANGMLVKGRRQISRLAPLMVLFLQHSP